MKNPYYLKYLSKVSFTWEKTSRIVQLASIKTIFLVSLNFSKVSKYFSLTFTRNFKSSKNSFSHPLFFNLFSIFSTLTSNIKVKSGIIILS